MKAAAQVAKKIQGRASRFAVAATAKKSGHSSGSGISSGKKAKAWRISGNRGSSGKEKRRRRGGIERRKSRRG